MNGQIRSSRRKAIRVSLILLVNVLLAAVNWAAISAQSAGAEPAAAAGLNEAESSRHTAASLGSTSIITSYTYLPVLTQRAFDCNPTGGSGGRSPGTYVTTVAGLDALIFVGQGYDPQSPTFLSFYLHGDEGNYTIFNYSTNPVKKLVNEHGWILVSPKTPQGTSWWQNWNEARNDALAGVFEAMFAQYNVCRNIVIGATMSGGSTFWSGYFFPEKGGQYQAHVSLLCGGLNAHNKASRQKVRDLGQNPTVVARSTFDYIYGTEDFLYNYIVNSIALYTEAGFRVQSLVLQGTGHCGDWTQQGYPGISQRVAYEWADRIQELGLEP
jgi:hypothetical protein